MLAAERHRDRAQRLTATVAGLGPTYIKLAQVFATRADIVPEPYLSELGTLTDRVPPLPIEVIQRVIAEEFGKPASSCSNISIQRRSRPRPLGRCTARCWRPRAARRVMSP